MPELISRSADNPEFARVVEVARLRDLPEFAFDIAPDAVEAAALARLMGARAVRRLRFRGRLRPLPGGGWRLEGELGATVVQTCVVTLDPVTTRIDQKVARSFLPGQAPAGPELVVGPDEDDEVEPLGAHIDLGLVATEALALALPAYPRKPGATLDPVAGRSRNPGEDAAVKPFAALAALRDKLGGGS
jgi:uncharacterized metal-binding protein YceD (DUF177 family)